MDIMQIKDYIDLASDLAKPLLGIIVAVYGWKKTGEIDLRKTMDLGVDVVRVFRKALDDGKTEEEALDEAVKEAEHLRRKSLSAKLAGKLKARVITLHDAAK